MKLALYTALSVLFSFSLASAQADQGKVTDKYDQPIFGVHVYNLSNDLHTHSDENGLFSVLNISVGDTLRLTHLSFETKTILVLTIDDLGGVQLKMISTAIDEVIITNQINALQSIADIEIQLNPVNSSQDILRKVPGLFIGQHAGGGKAEQIFLRGFDIDHGTDINLTVDGLPVNMVSHAHGQGYSDLHFIIPETIENIDFAKGPYQADKGNFATAGHVSFQTKEQLSSSTIKIEAGQFDTQRLLGMFDLVSNEQSNAYIASEFISTDGPFESPQNFNRINVFGKYTHLSLIHISEPTRPY